MSLRRQLLLVSLITLLLPWAAYQFIQEMEATLRQGQQNTLAAIARVLVQDLAGQPELLQDFATPAGSNLLYAHRLPTAPVLDGYADEWQALGLRAQRVASTDGEFAVQWLAGTAGDRFYLLLEVKDPQVRYERPDRAPEQTDQILLRFGKPQRDIRLPVAEPGPFMRDGRRGFYLPIQGAWQDHGAGYRLEISLPLVALQDGFGFAVLNAQPGVEGFWQAQSLGLVEPAQVAPLPQVIHSSDRLHAALAPYLQPGMRVSVVDRQGWLLAAGGETLNDVDEYDAGYSEAAGVNQERPGNAVLLALFRAVLEERAPRATHLSSGRGRLQGPAVESALQGQHGFDWYSRPGEARAVVAAALPVVVVQETQVPQRVQGAVLVEQTTDAIVSLSNQALLRLFGLSLGTLLAILVVLLGFASVLSWRVRQLRNRVERAAHPDGRLSQPFLPSRAPDELGDLSRSFAQMLASLRGYTEYLETFAGKLSHELKTPLAIIKSSLDNLELAEPGAAPAQSLQTQTQAAQSPYLARARQGVDRLSQILYAMREAARLEHSIADTEREFFDLTAVLQDAAPAYAGILPDHVWQWELPATPAPLYGSPELMIQLIDKLVENARDFTPKGGVIRLRLQMGHEGLVLDVENQGSQLPDGDIFASFVSLREPAGQEGHLGLGLVIVRLITAFHQGQVQAQNLANGAGVRMRVRLPQADSATN